MYELICEYCRFYQKYAVTTWTHLRPMEYGVLLIGIAVTGWALMKGSKR